MQASVRTQSGPYLSQGVQASQHSQVGSQHISDRNGNQIAGRPNSSSILYNLVTAGTTQPQSVGVIPQNGAYWSGQTTNWQAARGPQRTVSSQQVPTGGGNDYHQGAFTQHNAAMQASCVYAQSGNNPMPGRMNDVPQQAFHQYSSQKPPNQTPPNGIQQTVYLTQGFVWNQPVPIQGKQPVVTQDLVPLNELQHGNVENASYQNVNRILVQHPLALPAAATSVQHTQMSSAGTSMSTATYSQQMAHNLNQSSGYRIDGFQHGVSPHNAGQSQMSSSQSLKSVSHVMMSDSMSGQSLMQSTSQQTQQNAGTAISSSHSATHPSGPQYLQGLHLQKMNRLHTSIGTVTGQYMPKSQMIPQNVNNVNPHQTAGAERRILRVKNYVDHSGNKLFFTARDGMTQAGQTVQPDVSSTLEHCNSNAPHALKLQSGQTLSNPTCGLQSSNQHRSEAPPPYSALQKGFSSNRHSSEAPPPYPPAQKGFYVTVSEDKSGKGFQVDNIVFLGHDVYKNAILKGGLQSCSPNDSLQHEQLHQSAGKTSLLRNVQKSLENRHQLPPTPASSSKQNDGSNLASPSRAGQKAVAVVQPLSQANYKSVRMQGSSEMTSDRCKTSTADESGSIHEETSIARPLVDHIAKPTSLTHRQKSVDKNLCLEMSTEEGANATSSHDTGPSETQPNNIHAVHVESQPSDGMQCQVTPTSQPVTTEVPSSQSGEMGETKSQDNPVADEFDLSSVPLITWTYDILTMLTKRVHENLSTASQYGGTIPNIANTILSMFWEGSYENVLMKTDSYANLINEVEEFCSKHVASDSAILKTVPYKSWFTIKNNYYILGHTVDHPKNTYKSLWLNTNEQLDDIDKEFGFPWSLKYGLTILERDEQPTLTETENGIPDHMASEMQNEGVPPSEITTLSDDEYVEKEASSATDSLNQTLVPLENATADSIDSNYSFKIHVFPPEEARLLFEKLKTEQVETEKIKEQTENILNISVEDDLPEIVNVKLGEVTLENKVQVPTEEFCCATRWLEVMGGSNTHSLCNCQCRREQSADGVISKSFEVEKAVQTGTLHVIEPIKLDLTMESNIKVDVGIDMDNQTFTPTLIEQCENLIDLTEDDEMLHSRTNMEPKRILLSSTPSVDHSNIIVREIDDFFSCSESELSILTSGLVVDCGQAEQKQPGPAQMGLNTKQKQTHSILKDESPDSQLASTEKTDQVSFLSSLSLPQNKLCIPHPKNNPILKARRKRKRRADAPDSILPFLKKMKVASNSQPASEDNLKPVNEPFNGNDNTDGLEPIHSKVITVTLALFGSSPQKEHGTVVNRHGSLKSRTMSSRKNLFSDIAPVPPNTVTVTLNSWREEPTEFAPVVGSLVMKGPDKRGISEEHSATSPKLNSPVEQPMLVEPSETGHVLRSTVRQRIHEEWKNRFVPTRRKSRGRLMRLRNRPSASLWEVRPETTEARPPTITEELPVSFEGKSPPSTNKTKRLLSPQRREAFLNRLRLRVVKSKTHGVMPKKPAKIERSKYELGNPVLMPLQENNVLRFGLLPITFNFNDGPGDTEESTDPQLDMPDPDKASDKDPKITAKRCKGVWVVNPEKKHASLPSVNSQVLNTTTTTFKEYQKKYKEKRQPSKQPSDE